MIEDKVADLIREHESQRLELAVLSEDFSWMDTFMGRDSNENSNEEDY